MHVSVESSADARFEFACSAQSDDSTPVSVRWFHVDQDTDDEVAVRVIPDKLSVAENGSLIIQLAQNDTAGWGAFHGRYKCRASNLYSEAVREAVIHVTDYAKQGQYYTILFLSAIVVINVYKPFVKKIIRLTRFAFYRYML